MEYTAIVKRSGEWWIGWIEEVPGVNCRERTHEELRQSLAAALAEALEFNRRDALAAAGEDSREEKVVVPVRQPGRNQTVLGRGKGSVVVKGDPTVPMIPDANWEMRGNAQS